MCIQFDTSVHNGRRYISVAMRVCTCVGDGRLYASIYAFHHCVRWAYRYIGRMNKNCQFAGIEPGMKNL